MKTGLREAAEYRCDHRSPAMEPDAEKLLQLDVVNAFARLIEERGLDKARALADSIKQRCPSAVVLSEPKINAAANRIRAAGRFDEAIRVLEFNAEAFPDSFLAPYWLGEAYLAHGDTEKAIAAYRRSLVNDPFMLDAKERLQNLGALP